MTDQSSKAAALCQVELTKISLSQFPDADRERAYGSFAVLCQLGLISEAQYIEFSRQAAQACNKRRHAMRHERFEGMRENRNEQ